MGRMAAAKGHRESEPDILGYKTTVIAHNGREARLPATRECPFHTRWIRAMRNPWNVLARKNAPHVPTTARRLAQWPSVSMKKLSKPARGTPTRTWEMATGGYGADGKTVCNAA